MKRHTQLPDHPEECLEEGVLETRGRQPGSEGHLLHHHRLHQQGVARPERHCWVEAATEDGSCAAAAGHDDEADREAIGQVPGATAALTTGFDEAPTEALTGAGDVDAERPRGVEGAAGRR